MIIYYLRSHISPADARTSPVVPFSALLWPEAYIRRLPSSHLNFRRYTTQTSTFYTLNLTNSRPSQISNPEWVLPHPSSAPDASEPSVSHRSHPQSRLPSHQSAPHDDATPQLQEPSHRRHQAADTGNLNSASGPSQQPPPKHPHPHHPQLALNRTARQPTSAPPLPLRRPSPF